MGANSSKVRQPESKVQQVQKQFRQRMDIVSVIYARSVEEARRFAVDPQNKRSVEESSALCKQLEHEEMKAGTLGNLTNIRVGVVEYACANFDFNEGISKNGAKYTGEIKVGYTQQPQIARHTPSVTHSIDVTIGDGLGCFTSSMINCSGYQIDGLWEGGQPKFATLRYNDGSTYRGNFVLGYEAGFCTFPPPSLTLTPNTAPHFRRPKGSNSSTSSTTCRMPSQFTFVSKNNRAPKKLLLPSSPTFACDNLDIRWITPVKNWRNLRGYSRSLHRKFETRVESSTTSPMFTTISR